MSAPMVVLAGAAALGLYAYVGYPGILWAWSRLLAAPARPSEPTRWPPVSIVLSAYNEAATIGSTIEALLAADYPAELRHILVVSDASTDGTDDIVHRYAGRGVELLRQPVRAGKTAAENASIDHLRGQIIVSTDASIRVRPDAVKPLVARFADPTVGVASGRDVSVARADDTANVGESGYVGYEMWVRGLETQVHGIVGASGCFYAIRKPLYAKLSPEALSRDFLAALWARQAGLRAVSVDEAVCFVPRASGLREEFRRKVRTFTRGLETVHYGRQLLNPFRYGRFAWMLFSHKLCRWMLPWAGLAATVALVVMATQTAWARAVLVIEVTHVALALAAWWWPRGRRMPRLVGLAAFTFWSSVAVLLAWIRALSGELNPLWEPTRRESAA